MSQANVEVVERFEEAFVRGDMDEVLSLLAPDVVVREAPSLPYPGDHQGHDGFLRLADAFSTMWEIFGDLDLTFPDAGETHVVVLVAFDVVSRPTASRSGSVSWTSTPSATAASPTWTCTTATRRRSSRPRAARGSSSAVIGAPSRLGANSGLGGQGRGGDALRRMSLSSPSTTTAGRPLARGGRPAGVTTADHT